jgi:CYTH domain-containing protein
MAVKSIRLGQVWRNDSSGQDFLVTKVYNEVFTQYAMLRQATADAANAETVRIRVQKDGENATLPGYTFTQESQDF